MMTLLDGIREMSLGIARIEELCWELITLALGSCV